MASLTPSIKTKLFFYLKSTSDQIMHTLANVLLSNNVTKLSFTQRNNVILNTITPLCEGGYIDKTFLGTEYITDSLTNKDLVVFLTKDDGNLPNTGNFISAMSLVYINDNMIEIDILVSMIIYKYGGSNLLTYLLTAMRESEIRLCILKSLNTAFTFYQRYGFTYLGRKTKKTTNINTTELYFVFDTIKDKIPSIKGIILNESIITHIIKKTLKPVRKILNVNELEQFITNQNIDNNVNIRSIPTNIITRRKEGTRNNKNNPRWYIKKNNKSKRN